MGGFLTFTLWSILTSIVMLLGYAGGLIAYQKPADTGRIYASVTLPSSSNGPQSSQNNFSNAMLADPYNPKTALSLLNSARSQKNNIAHSFRQSNLSKELGIVQQSKGSPSSLSASNHIKVVNNHHSITATQIDPRIKTIHTAFNTSQESNISDNNNGKITIDIPESQHPLLRETQEEPKKQPIKKTGTNWPTQFGKAFALPLPKDDLLENTAYGRLPKIGHDKPWHYYRHPVKKTHLPQMGLVIAGLGLDKELTQKAIETLPPQVTLGFVPYAKNLQSWITKARALGHEVILEVPLEPLDSPRTDTGEKVLLTDVKAAQNQEKLHWLLGRAQGYSGIMNYLGSRFFNDETASSQLLENLHKRGLYFLETPTIRPGQIKHIAKRINIPYKAGMKIIDNDLRDSTIFMALNTTLERAREDKQAVAIGYATPNTLQVLRQWLATFPQRSIRLTPISALVHTYKKEVKE